MQRSTTVCDNGLHTHIPRDRFGRNRHRLTCACGSERLGSAMPNRMVRRKAEYSVEETAKLLNVSRETVRRYIRKKRLKALRKPVKGLKEEYRITHADLSSFKASMNGGERT
jgi:excisionase family DNA binding protein